MNREPNHRLAALMADAGASNKGLARRVRDVALRHGVRVGTTHVSVQRWLDGAGIQADNAAYLAEALSAKLGRRVTASDLGFSGVTINPSPIGTSYAASLAEALGVLDGLTQLRPEDEPFTDELLHDNEVSSAVLSWLVARPDGLPSDRGAPRRIGMRDVAAVRTANAMFMRLDFLFGGGHGHAALRHYFRHEVLPLLSAGYSEKVGQALFTAAAEMGEVLAWTAYDVGNHHLANRYLLAALRLTQITDDRMMGAALLANMSHQANYLGDVPRAARLARAAVEGGRGRTTPRAQAMFAAHEARALSNAHDHVGASRALNEAERHFERADSATDPEWLAYFDEAELIGEFSHCFRDLQRPAESLRFAELAVGKTEPQYARTLAFCRMVLAQSHYLHGDVGAAVATATTAVREGESVQSARFRRYVSDFQRQVSPQASNSAVRDFNDHVRVALADPDDE
ncbi:sporulation protein [Streptomyces sp. NBC_01476]|uniref:sporulation protein n=1 Tax=Streptomyces sp. NBC_01476 TaxID=2903881 RepID=UPI002E2F1E18|nr:sporulation protein [Streptomyces sp. NBC_01476]